MVLSSLGSISICSKLKVTQLRAISDPLILTIAFAYAALIGVIESGHRFDCVNENESPLFENVVGRLISGQSSKLMANLMEGVASFQSRPHSLLTQKKSGQNFRTEVTIPWSGDL